MLFEAYKSVAVCYGGNGTLVGLSPHSILSPVGGAKPGAAVKILADKSQAATTIAKHQNSTIYIAGMTLTSNLITLKPK